MIKISELAGARVPPSVIAFDPGGTTGIAHFNPLYTDAVNIADMPGFLASHGPPHLVVAESFNLRPHQAQAQAGSDMPASRVLGMLELWCYEHSASLALIPPTAKRAGRLYAEKYLPDLTRTRATAKGEHRRDACDLLAYAIRTLTIGAGP